MEDTSVSEVRRLFDEEKLTAKGVVAALNSQITEVEAVRIYVTGNSS